MNKSLRVGITGGIGSGKSLICRALETMGYPVYNSDVRAKELMESDPEIREQLIAAFGCETFDGETLNRRYLAEKIFTDEASREKINGIVHPAVRKDFQQWAESQVSAIVFQESALLFETGAYKNFDHTILVTAPAEERIRRVMERDHADEEAVRARIASQLSDEEKIPLAGFVIDNGTGVMVLPQINAILKQFSTLLP